MKTYVSFSFILVFSISLCLQAQQTLEFVLPRTNPKASISQQVASTIIEITYYRPNLKGRTVFGNLVPYNQVWRTGADAATQISISTSLMVEGHNLDVGSYELFTIPGKEKWTIIFQKAQKQWGSYAYKPENDVLRVVVTPEKTSNKIESFTISLDEITSSTAIMNLSWENVRVPIKMEIDLKSTVIPELENALKAKDKPPYFQAAMFYYENDIDIDRAAELMTLAVEENPRHLGMLYRLALILEKQGDTNGAIDAAKRSLDETEDAPPELKAEYEKLNGIILRRLEG